MSSLRPNQPDNRLFPHPVGLIAHGNVHDLRFVQNALLMAEGFEAPFAVVSAHAAVSDASKGQFRRCQVHHGVIDAAAAEGAGIQHAAFGCLVCMTASFSETGNRIVGSICRVSSFVLPP